MDPSPLHSVLGCSGHSCPVGPLLLQLSFSVLPPTVARPSSPSLPLWVPGQGLACGAGCWLPEGVSDPASLPPQYLLGHWFVSSWFPQIFILDLLLPLGFVDAPQTGAEEFLSCLRAPQFWIVITVLDHYSRMRMLRKVYLSNLLIHHLFQDP